MFRCSRQRETERERERKTEKRDKFRPTTSGVVD